MCYGWARRALVALVVLVATAGTAGAAEFHYALIFGAGLLPKRPLEAHSWAVFVRAVGEGPDPSAYAVEARVISWLPETLPVRPLALRPEPGRNFTLPETFATVLKYESRVTMWGPFLIDREHYERANQVASMLDLGLIQYRVLTTTRTPEVANCILAVADVDNLFGADYRPLCRVGKRASLFLARQVASQSLADPSLGDHAWLIPRLGLDRYPIDVVPARCVVGQGGFSPCRCHGHCP